MQNLWDDNIANQYKSDLALRVYTSNLLGKSDELVLHGGGNTSVKSVVDNEEILFVKGSGWDLVSIKEEGFSPVKLNILKNMAKLESLSDMQMVQQQKEAMINKLAPNPSVEAILHAIIPFKYVDHTHADAVVTISNCVNGIKNIQKVFPNFLIIPYVMPGFILAKEIYNLTKDGFNWDKCEGIILHNHGIFTFDDDAKKSYDKMINAVSLAQNFIKQNTNFEIEKSTPIDYPIQELKNEIAKSKGQDIVMKINQSSLALHFSNQKNLSKFASRGVLTPEHIIRTKRIPLILEDENIKKALYDYEEEYKNYFNRYAKNELIFLCYNHIKC